MVDSVEPNIFVEKYSYQLNQHLVIYLAVSGPRHGFKKNEFVNENIIKIKKLASEEDTFECSNTNS